MQSRKRRTRKGKVALMVAAAVLACTAIAVILTLRSPKIAAGRESDADQSAQDNTAQIDNTNYPAQVAPVPTSLDNLVASHPRMIVLDRELAATHAAIESDPEAQAQYNQLVGFAAQTLNQPVIKSLGNGDSLGPGRTIVMRIVTLAGLYRLTHQREYATRAIAEMLSATSLPTWASGQFLTIGELTAGVGIGYDWLFNELTPDQQQQIRSGTERLGFVPFLSFVHKGHAVWHSNWGFAINGGETVGALAIAEHSDQKVYQEAAEILSFTRPTMARQIADYGPDGALNEGPTYWNYASLYTVLYLSALQSSLGTDFGQSDIPGFSKTGDYKIAIVGPTGLQANFGDAVAPVEPSHQMFWLAKRFQDAAYTQFEVRALQNWRGNPGQAQGDPIDTIRFGMMGLVWYAEAPKNNPPRTPLLENFRGVEQSFLRSSLDDNAWYVAFKGGQPNVGHRHLDLGSFIFDAEGRRFGTDLGMENYSVPGYFDGGRWNVFRARTESHSTITVGNSNEAFNASVSILRSQEKKSYRFTIMDLKNAYPDTLTDWKRGVRVTNDSTFTLQDELSTREPADLTWHLLTAAHVTVLPGAHAVKLSSGTTSIVATLPENFPYKFETEIPFAPPPQLPLGNVTSVVIHLSQVSGQLTIPVVFTRIDAQKPSLPGPLESW